MVAIEKPQYDIGSGLYLLTTFLVKIERNTSHAKKLLTEYSHDWSGWFCDAAVPGSPATWQWGYPLFTSSSCDTLKVLISRP